MQTRSSPSIEILHGLAEEAGMKSYRHISKFDLYQLLQNQYNFSRLQRLHQRRQNGNLIKKEKKMKKYHQVETLKNKLPLKKIYYENECPTSKSLQEQCNTLDPIMFTELGEHRFSYVRSNGSIIQYNVETLVEYFLATGDFSEPGTRIQFTDEQLKRLDSEAKRAGLRKKSVWEAKKKYHQTYQEKKIQRDGVLGLERCAGELVSEMLHIIENCNPEDGEMRFVLSVFPHFSDLFRQLSGLDKEYAAQCIKHYVQFIKGPPNRPTVDHHGFLDIVLDFLNQVKSGVPSCHDYGF